LSTVAATIITVLSTAGFGLLTASSLLDLSINTLNTTVQLSSPLIISGATTCFLAKILENYYLNNPDKFVALEQKIRDFLSKNENAANVLLENLDPLDQSNMKSIVWAGSTIGGSMKANIEDFYIDGGDLFEWEML
jgi:hypothetical protein